MLDPKGAVQQWVVLLRGPQVEPNVIQPAQRPKLGLGHMRIIIPEEFASQRGPIDDEASGEQQRDAGQYRAPVRPRLRGHGCNCRFATPRFRSLTHEAVDALFGD